MKPKAARQKFSLRILSPTKPSTSSTPQVATPSPPSTPAIPRQRKGRHLSLHHEKEEKKKRDAKNAKLEMAVKYCKDNNCKGYKAVKALNLKD